LEARLRSSGYQVVRDPPRVEGDPFWRQSLVRSLERCDAIVVVWSARAARSPWVEHERRAFPGPCLFACLDATAVPHHPQGYWSMPGETTDWLRRVTPPQSREGGPRPAVTRPATIARSRAARILEEEARLAAFIERFHGFRRRMSPGRRASELVLADGSKLLAVPSPTSDPEGGRAVFVAEAPVTNEQYRRFLEHVRRLPPATWEVAAFRDPAAPVVGVTWYEARAYAAWTGADLPTEREWALAAAAGVSGAEFATADGSLRDELACYGGRPGEGAPVQVTAHSANPAGFYGMSGNTWDWCLDTEGPHRSIRGGSYQDNREFCRIEARYRNSPIDRDCCVGFRLAVRVDPSVYA
jgi:Sulfatase-modifying factor enzyme 1